ncbi:rhodanese-like domain-containing protein [Streptococcus ratti]|uniref:Rhodanese-like domain-containing protein n=1 Tax=Streptococcus ratti TaxID=1341 RepID=A0A7X9LEA5_STRRT|nr:rhodanese-like domain-containing protein [Streptococcus ratti]NMD49591.1 rhodanese-like domain-containing protein [Streptococcus ratti]
MIKVVDIKAIKEDLEAKAFNLIDVREADEFAAGRVPGAVNLPLSELASRYQGLAADKPYHIICQMGTRSAQACAFLDSKGYDVTNISGGTSAWMGALEQ